jgi:hypothetical protein
MATRSGVPGETRSDLPPPSYHVRDVDLMYFLCRFDPDAVARIVPPELIPSGNGTI